MRAFEIANAAPHAVAFAGDDLALALDFGNVEADRDPLAVEDEFLVQTNSNSATLDVLMNDAVAPNDTKTIIHVGATDSGASAIIDAGGQTVSYTPLPGFVGVDSFNYTFEVLDGRTHSTTVTVVVKNIDQQTLLRGQKWNDLNGNGVFDESAGESPLEGVTVYIDLNNNQQLDGFESSRITDSDGRYEFSVFPGTHVIREIPPDDMVQTFPLAPAPAIPIAVAGVVEHLYDDATGILYIATSSGSIQRYDVASQSLLTPWQIGTSLSALEINAERTFLYATEKNKIGGNGQIWKIAIDDGATTSITFGLNGSEDGIVDIAITTNDRAFVTTSYLGSGFVPLREIDLGDHSVSVRSDLGDIDEGTRVFRSADRRILHFTEGLGIDGGMFNYFADSDSFSSEFSVFAYLSNANAALDSDGTLLAQQSIHRGLSIFDTSDITREILRPLQGGVIFDPIRDRLYAGDSDSRELVAFDTITGDTLFRLPVGEPILSFPTQRDMSISDNGELLFLQTNNGIRMFDLNEPGGHTVSVGANQIVEQLDFGNQGEAEGIVGRHVYYHGSEFDTNDVADAIAYDKSPLFLRETATAANFTSYVQGINGLVIDIAANAPLTIADFEFRVGNDNNPSAWEELPGEPTVSPPQDVDGNNGLDRIVFFFPEEIAVRNAWLEVTVLANSRTGLQQNEVFYFGNKISDSTGDGLTDASDFVDTRQNPTTFLDPAALDNARDFNRDSRVDAIDLLIVRDHSTNASQALNLITPASGSVAKSSLAWVEPVPLNKVDRKSLPTRMPTTDEAVATGDDDEARIAALTLLAKELAEADLALLIVENADDAIQDLLESEEQWANTTSG